MKKLNQLALGMALLVTLGASAQKKEKTTTPIAKEVATSKTITKGTVTYEMELPDNEEAAAMGTSLIKISFDGTKQATEIEMMGGMMNIKTIAPVNSPKETRMLMNMMGKKFELINLPEEQLTKGPGANFNNLENAVSVSYDKKDIKEIAGYKCHKAEIKMEDGSTNIFYVTELISQAQKTNENAKVKLVGFPMEMTMTTPQGKAVVKATEFKTEIPTGAFEVTEDYKKVTQEQLQEELGGF
ncbi:hypothetical protein [Flavobacterium sp.]|jgi:hypothetical protein|uniref:hypothetical protein n=1 Tax=Flavobacterium sp. TaxID=239 RepID=UPI0025B9E2AF|nr:hypothetical protein [Flavobacterium sp.]